MFCFQCQEAAKGTGCSIKGVCGKTPEVSNLQDLLLFTLKGISFYKDKPECQSLSHPEIDKFVIEGLFSTITNANFSETVFYHKIRQALTYREMVKRDFLNQGGQLDLDVPEAAIWYASSNDDFDTKAETIGVLATENEDIRSLRELLIYGLKGIAAYAEHALTLGYLSDGIFKFTYTALASTLNNELTADELTALVLKCGEYGVEVMALLDKANTDSYGHPEITEVNLGVRNNPGILISGHDLKDMEELLLQSEGTGVDIYTHSEMLPAHYYPKFKKYDHFVGNYGNAWWQQTTEFEKFNGPVLLTTNCLVPPKTSYIDRVYTTGQAGFKNVKHIADREPGKAKDFSALIEHAKKCAAPIEIETGSIVGGFAHNQVVQLADKVVDAVKTGAIKKFFVMAGCDGRVKGRNYYTEFANTLPNDTVILTAGCAKYRYNKLALGDIGGIPRVLDAGQCNDSYSLVVIALKLKEIFELEDINDLPIAYNIAWYEQKAVIVLLALLYLGVKDIHLGPTLPAFLSPNVANVLVKNFGISGIGEVEADLNHWLAISDK
jgi:hydroxylamine reductase